MYHFLRRSFAAILLLLIPAAAIAETFKAGQDYEVIQSTAPQKLAGKNILVQEFFSYACPGCYHLEPTIAAWLNKKPKNVIFERIPVIFQPAWEPYAKAYYTAQSLDVLKKIHPALFKALHQDRRNLTSEEEMSKFFVENGVKNQDFSSVYDFAPGMIPRLNKAMELMRTYQVREVPVLVINGHYKLTLSMAKSEERFITILNFLIKEAQKNGS